MISSSGNTCVKNAGAPTRYGAVAQTLHWLTAILRLAPISQRRRSLFAHLFRRARTDPSPARNARPWRCRKSGVLLDLARVRPQASRADHAAVDGAGQPGDAIRALYAAGRRACDGDCRRVVRGPPADPAWRHSAGPWHALSANLGSDIDASPHDARQCYPLGRGASRGRRSFPSLCPAGYCAEVNAAGPPDASARKLRGNADQALKKVAVIAPDLWAGNSRRSTSE